MHCFIASVAPTGRNIVPAGPCFARRLAALFANAENRPDAATVGSRSVVTFDVDTYDDPHPVAEAALALWYACNQTVANRLVELRIGEGGNGVATVAPALGPHERKRLTGCLKDATIDRVRGDVIRIVDTAPTT